MDLRLLTLTRALTLTLTLRRTALRSSLLAAMRLVCAGDRPPLEDSSPTWWGLGVGVGLGVGFGLGLGLRAKG